MSEKTFKVVIRGVAQGRPLGEVKNNLAKLFKASPEKIAALLQRKSVVVKKGLDRPKAQQYQQMIHKAGAVCDIAVDAATAEPAGSKPAPESTPPPAPSPPAESMVCPKCGHEQESSSTCDRCGIVFAKHVKSDGLKPRQQNRYFEHSGSFSVVGIILMIISGSFATAVLSFIYGYAIYYIPFIYLNFLITIIFGGAVGYAVGFGGKLGHVRSLGLLLVFGFIFGLAAEYLGWVSWIHALSGQTKLTFAPSEMFPLIAKIARHGAWSIFGWTPRGGSLYLIWGIEAALIIGFAPLVAGGLMGSTPYCEKCHRWVEEKTSIFPLETDFNSSGLVSELESAKYDTLLALRKTNAHPDEYTQVDLLHCTSCRQLHLLSVTLVKIERDKDGKEDKSEEELIENLVIDAEAFKTLRQNQNWR